MTRISESALKAREFLFRQQQSQEGNTHTVVVQLEWQERVQDGPKRMRIEVASSDALVHSPHTANPEASAAKAASQSDNG